MNKEVGFYVYFEVCKDNVVVNFECYLNKLVIEIKVDVGVVKVMNVFGKKVDDKF